MSRVANQLANAFVCAKCNSRGAHVEKVAMSGTGLSRLLEFQPYRYVHASCYNCGYTEVYNLQMLEGKDNLGAFLDLLFVG